MKDAHYASLTFQGVQHREIIQVVTHPGIIPVQQATLNFGERTGTGVSL